MTTRQTLIRSLDFYYGLPGAEFPQAITDKALPGRGGRTTRTFLYFLWNADALIYVGVTREPRKRLLAHWYGDNSTPRKTFDRATWWELPNRGRAFSAERVITRAYEPLHNVKNTRRDPLSGRFRM